MDTPDSGDDSGVTPPPTRDSTAPTLTMSLQVNPDGVFRAGLDMIQLAVSKMPWNRPEQPEPAPIVATDCDSAAPGNSRNHREPNQPRGYDSSLSPRDRILARSTGPHQACSTQPRPAGGAIVTPGGTAEVEEFFQEVVGALDALMGIHGQPTGFPRGPAAADGSLAGIQGNQERQERHPDHGGPPGIADPFDVFRAPGATGLGGGSWSTAASWSSSSSGGTGGFESTTTEVRIVDGRRETVTRRRWTDADGVVHESVESSERNPTAASDSQPRWPWSASGANSADSAQPRGGFGSFWPFGRW